ncbi:MAG: hypothetical protein BM557_06315 [Flavobacterium sp. MedPE-SWcel]|nr:MAG: hypothetical protein BM557_06315 [Flavobacterium sp. MedPE-SWcel]
MKPMYELLHEMEEDLIQIEGLLKALQLLLPDGAAHDCVVAALEKRLAELQVRFYGVWNLVKNEGCERGVL